MPPPGVEVGAQVLDITQRFRPDFVIAHLFGRSPAAAIKAFKSNGYPLSKVVGLVWASSEADIVAAGGFGAAEGYHAMQFAGAGDDYPVRQQIKAMYKKERQRAARADGREHGLLQPRPASGGDPCRGDPQRAEGQRRQASRPAPTSRRASSRSATSLWAGSSRRWRSRRPTTKAAAGCRSSRSRAASSSRRPTGSAPTATSSSTAGKSASTYPQRPEDRGDGPGPACRIDDAGAEQHRGRL